MENPRLLDRMRDALRARHYSPRTEDTPRARGQVLQCNIILFMKFHVAAPFCLPSDSVRRNARLSPPSCAGQIDMLAPSLRCAVSKWGIGRRPYSAE
jgi:hypothetical protein